MRPSLVAIAALFAALSPACSNTDNPGTTPTESPSGTPLTVVPVDSISAIAAFGLQAQQVRNYSETTTAGNVTVEPFIQLNLIGNNEVVCTLVISEGADYIVWQQDPVPTGLALPLPESQAVLAGFEVNFGSATTTVTDVDGLCGARLSDSVWTADPAAAIQSQLFGVAVHDGNINAYPSRINATDTIQDDLESFMVTANGLDQTVWDAEWAPNLIGGAINLGSYGSVGMLWGARAHVPDVAAGPVTFHFQVPNVLNSRGTALQTPNIDAIYRLSTPYVLGFNSQADLAAALTGSTARDVAPPVPRLTPPGNAPRPWPPGSPSPLQ